MFTVEITALLTLTIAFTLCTDIIPQHGTENEILFGRKLVERSGHHQSDGVETLFLAEEQVESLRAHALDDITDSSMFKSSAGKGLIAFVESEEHHAADSLLQLIDMIHEHLHVGR